MALEVIGIVHSLVHGVLDWVEQNHKLKEQIGGFIIELKNVQYALNVLKKYEETQMDENFKQLLMNLRSCVMDGSEHVEKLAQSNKKFFSSPKKHIKKIEDCRTALGHIVPILTLTVSALEKTPKSPSKPVVIAVPSPSHSGQSRRLTPDKLITDKDALEFWKKYFGDDTEVPMDKFMKRVIRKFRLAAHLNDCTRSALESNLDDNGDGTLTAWEYQQFVTTFGSLERGVKKLVLEPDVITQAEVEEDEKHVQSQKELADDEADDAKEVDVSYDVIWAVPTINEYDQMLVDAALAKNLKVLHVKSPAALVDYLRNRKVQHYIRQFPDKVRLITNNHDYHPDFDMVPNGHGGNQVIKAMKKARLRCALLIYCNYTLPQAKELVIKHRPVRKNNPTAVPIVNVFCTDEDDVAESFITFGPLDKIPLPKCD